MMVIACVQIPNLPIALARQADPAMAAHPLVLYSGERRLAAVYAASDEAGVPVGMPLHRAYTRCPQARYVPAVPAREAQFIAALSDRLGVFSPRVAAVAPPPNLMVALDLGRASVPRAIALADRIGERVRAAFGLVPALGVASSLLIARQAARRAGAGAAVLVPPGQESHFLAPQPVGSLVPDPELIERLTRLGLRTLGDLARVPLDALQAQFGIAGQQLYQLARGIDTVPIPKMLEAPIISTTRRFAGPLLDSMLLERAIADRAAHLAADLQAGGWAAGMVTLALDCDDGEAVVLERVLVEPTSDQATLGAVLLGLARSAALTTGVTSIRLIASRLIPVVVAQLELFASEGGQAKRLQEVLGRLSARFAGSLLRASVTDPAALLPERRIRLERR